MVGWHLADGDGRAVGQSADAYGQSADAYGEPIIRDPTAQNAPLAEEFPAATTRFRYPWPLAEVQLAADLPNSET